MRKCGCTWRRPDPNCEEGAYLFSVGVRAQNAMLQRGLDQKTKKERVHAHSEACSAYKSHMEGEA